MYIEFVSSIFIFFISYIDYIIAYIEFVLSACEYNHTKSISPSKFTV